MCLTHSESTMSFWKNCLVEIKPFLFSWKYLFQCLFYFFFLKKAFLTIAFWLDLVECSAASWYGTLFLNRVILDCRGCPEYKDEGDQLCRLRLPRLQWPTVLWRLQIWIQWRFLLLKLIPGALRSELLVLKSLCFALEDSCVLVSECFHTVNMTLKHLEPFFFSWDDKKECNNLGFHSIIYKNTPQFPA